LLSLTHQHATPRDRRRRSACDLLRERRHRRDRRAPPTAPTPPSAQGFLPGRSSARSSAASHRDWVRICLAASATTPRRSGLRIAGGEAAGEGLYSPVYLCAMIGRGRLGKMKQEYWHWNGGYGMGLWLSGSVLFHFWFSSVQI